MNIVWTSIAWKQYVEMQAQDKKVIKKINEIIKDIQRNGNEGIGKAEALKHEVGIGVEE